MPLYSFHCIKCKNTQDELLSVAMGVSERVQYADSAFSCEECGSSNWSSRINVPQLDSSSNTFRESVNGYYSKALGRHISSRKEEQKIMESRGFVCEADLPKHTWEEAEEKSDALPYCTRRICNHLPKQIGRRKNQRGSCSRNLHRSRCSQWQT